VSTTACSTLFPCRDLSEKMMSRDPHTEEWKQSKLQWERQRKK
jgi:hypothetical protein